MLQDLRFGVRMLLRSPGFAALALLCLTLGIGADTTVFSWIEGVLLRPYPLVRDEDRLLVLAGTEPGALKGAPVSWPDFLDFQRRATRFDAFIAEKIVGTTLGIGTERAERAAGSVVSANYFDALGVRPALGRAFEPGEDIGRRAHAVVVISHQFWERAFESDPAAVGRTVRLNGVPHTIVGVAPEGFYGTFVGYQFQFWAPASMQEVFDPGGYKLEDRGARWIEGFARLKPGVTRAQAQVEISAMADRLQAEYPSTNRGRGITLQPLWRSPFNPMEALVPTLAIALIVVAAVLLIACANVGNLLLLRSFARRREMTIRLAVGATRWRIARQLLTEAVILTALAGAGGLLAAFWARDGLVLLFPPRGATALRLPAELDWRVLALAIGVCLTSTVISGLVPAILGSDVDLIGSLKSESTSVVGRSGKARVRSGLVALQVALSFVLVVGALLVVQSLQRMRNASPGFGADRVLASGVDLVSAGYDDRRANVFRDGLIDRLEALPGVESAAFVRVTPFAYVGYSSAPIAVDGYDARPGEPPTVDYDEIGPSYLRTIGIPLVRGREFSRDDDESSEAVAVVNEAMAARFWDGRDPVGSELRVGGRRVRVVGIAKMAKYRNLQEPARPFFYLPLRQTGARAQAFVIRSPLDAGAMAAALAREIRALDASLVPAQVITMREQINRTMSAERMAVTLLTAFGVVAVLLATIGLYGVMSFTVSHAGRELGLRLALGAAPSSLLRGVLRSGLTLSGAGILAGATAAFALTRLLGTLLYEVSPRDPAAFAAALILMIVASLAACLVPARRAMRTDPLIALRG